MIATLAGDLGAFDALVERYQGRVFNVALRVTGHREDALDATQSAFMKAFDSLRTFDLERSFFSWLCRIGVNEALDIVRGRNRYAELDVQVPAAAAGPEEESRGRETGQKIQVALSRMKPDHRVVVILRHFHGLTYREMAEVIGIPAKTVKSRLFTARRELRERLEAEGLLR